MCIRRVQLQECRFFSPIPDGQSQPLVRALQAPMTLHVQRISGSLLAKPEPQLGGLSGVWSGFAQ